MLVEPNTSQIQNRNVSQLPVVVSPYSSNASVSTTVNAALGPVDLFARARSELNRLRRELQGIPHERSVLVINKNLIEERVSQIRKIRIVGLENEIKILHEQENLLETYKKSCDFQITKLDNNIQGATQKLAQLLTQEPDSLPIFSGVGVDAALSSNSPANPSSGKKRSQDDMSGSSSSSSASSFIGEETDQQSKRTRPLLFTAPVISLPPTAHHADVSLLSAAALSSSVYSTLVQPNLPRYPSSLATEIQPAASSFSSSIAAVAQSSNLSSSSAFQPSLHLSAAAYGSPVPIPIDSTANPLSTIRSLASQDPLHYFANLTFFTPNKEEQLNVLIFGFFKKYVIRLTVSQDCIYAFGKRKIALVLPPNRTNSESLFFHKEKFVAKYKNYDAGQTRTTSVQKEYSGSRVITVKLSGYTNWSSFCFKEPNGKSWESEQIPVRAALKEKNPTMLPRLAIGSNLSALAPASSSDALETLGNEMIDLIKAQRNILEAEHFRTTQTCANHVSRQRKLRIQQIINAESVSSNSEVSAVSPEVLSIPPIRLKKGPSDHLTVLSDSTNV